MSELSNNPRFEGYSVLLWQSTAYLEPSRVDTHDDVCKDVRVFLWGFGHGLKG